MVCVSSDGMKIFAHKVCVAAASPSLQEQIEKASDFTDAGHDHPILQFSEQSGLLADLLRLCYPDRKLSQLPSDPLKLADILVAVDTYKMDTIHGMVFELWKTIAEESPIRAYLAASRHGVRLRGCAEVAAKCTLHHPLEGQYVAEMEFAPAVAYHHLLSYHASCRMLAKKILRGVLPALPSNSRSCSDSAGVPSTPVFGPQYSCRNSWQLARVDTAIILTITSQDAWLASFIKDLIARADTCCTYAPLSPTAFDAALAEENLSLWCTRCRDFTRKISATDAAVLSINGRILQEVSLVF